MPLLTSACGTYVERSRGGAAPSRRPGRARQRGPSPRTDRAPRRRDGPACRATSTGSTPPPGHRAPRRIWTIPVCAGSSSGPSEPGRCPRDHSRMRGSRLPPSPSTRFAWDHPCGCGEQATVFTDIGLMWGPTPRARGAAAPHRREHPRGGTISACAERSRARCSTESCCRDHPRRRGGAVLGLVLGLLDRGSIPARAGIRGRRRAGRRPAGDHPRGRGEQSDPARLEYWPTGPSPRARGVERQPDRQQQLVGTIPAGAGNRAREPTGR